MCGKKNIFNKLIVFLLSFLITGQLCILGNSNAFAESQPTSNSLIGAIGKLPGAVQDMVQAYADFHSLELAIKIANLYMELQGKIPSGTAKTIYFYVDSPSGTVDYNFDGYIHSEKYRTDLTDPTQAHLPYYSPPIEVTGIEYPKGGGVEFPGVPGPIPPIPGPDSIAIDEGGDSGPPPTPPDKPKDLPYPPDSSGEAPEIEDKPGPGGTVDIPGVGQFPWPPSGEPGGGNGDPTFIYAPKGKSIIKVRKAENPKSSLNIFALISVPSEKSLVRGNVPVFGLAYGKSFKRYKVEYGEGKDPKDWILIKQSTTLQTKDVTPADLDFSADITIHGNLATWDTGLKSYVYLPDYPPDHPMDLNGVYTLRLVVTGENGETAEDRTTIEVGEAISNAWGGVAKSKDKKATINVNEQSLTDTFRVISIKPVEEAPGVSVDNKRKLVGKVYEFREAGEKFTKDAIVKIGYSEKALKTLDRNRLGIYGYNQQKKEWIYLKSTRNEKEKKLAAVVRELSPYYAIFASAQKGEGSVAEKLASAATRSEQSKTLRAADDNKMYLVRDAFEDGMGEWSNRDGDVGAEVKRDNTATSDGTYCLKLANTNDGGNFASNIRRTPFDTREYPIVQFDYKIPPDVKTNFIVKVNSRWYEIRFTGVPKELRNTRVNIANIGRIENVIADDKWHTARFNLYEMLRTKTGNHIVNEMIMADWNAGGYMKLKFGTNRQGATFYIDNFTISKESSSGPRIDGGVLLIDNFDQTKEVNSLGGISNVFTNSVEGKVQLSYVGNDNDSKKGSYALQISYDVSQKGSFACYITQLPNLDIREYKTLSFAIKASKSGERFKVGLKDRSGNESKILVNDYVPQGIGTTWQRVAIPLAAFSNINDWGTMENLSLAFENILGSGEGAVLVGYIQFEKDFRSLTVNNFENDNDNNLLGGRSWTFSNGAAGINGGYEKDSSNKIYRLSYGGEIGDLFTYAGWTTQLQGIDVSQCKSVSLLVKGVDGGEEPNIYLDDGNFRWGVYINRYKPITTSWQKITIPLKDFAGYGVDLTHLEELQVVFEWERMSGVIYIDDIRFDCSGDKVKEK